jgi:hypothetical protein
LRKLIGLLLALNLGMLAVGLAWQFAGLEASQPLIFNADKIRLLDLPPRLQSDKAETLVDAIDQPPADTASEVASEAVAPEPPQMANLRCLAWQRLDAAGLRAIETYLKQVGIEPGVYSIQLQKKLGWWVYLPPLEDVAAGLARIDQIIQLGIKDYAQVRGGPMRNAVSLGAFPSLVQAREHAAFLTRKGLKGFELGPRLESGVASLILSTTISDAELASMETQLKTGWPEGLQPAACALP